MEKPVPLTIPSPFQRLVELVYSFDLNAAKVHEDAKNIFFFAGYCQVITICNLYARR